MPPGLRKSGFGAGATAVADAEVEAAATGVRGLRRTGGLVAQPTAKRDSTKKATGARTGPFTPLDWCSHGSAHIRWSSGGDRPTLGPCARTPVESRGSVETPLLPLRAGHPRSGLRLRRLRWQRRDARRGGRLAQRQHVQVGKAMVARAAKAGLGAICQAVRAARAASWSSTSKSPTPAHDACYSGLPLPEQCSPCVGTVCGQRSSCCSDHRDDECTHLARGVAACACEDGGIGTGVGGSTGTGTGGTTGTGTGGAQSSGKGRHRRDDRHRGRAELGEGGTAGTSLVVPVLPATGKPIPFIRAAVPRCTTPSRMEVI